ncbi:MAG: hypothetical protein VX278_09640 [Myxococcota bacterium]|nr:hypothetical protein [Myxococcota bacterium]
MSLDPLKSLGYWRGKEIAIEGFLPVAISGYCIWKVKGLTSAISISKPFTTTEILVFLGALVAILSWATSRQLYMFGRRKPIVIAVFASLISLGVVFTLSRLAVSGFESSCVDTFQGQLIQSLNVWGGGTTVACQIGGVAGNGYLPGTILRPSWNGNLELWMWAFFGFVAATAGVAFRDKRFIATGMILNVYKLLEYAAASGVDGCLGGKPKDGKVFACANPTLWGEICGQLYSGAYEFEPGEWCGRCGQPFTKSERELTFNVVSLFTDNIDILNMLEKKDTLSWDIPGKIPADGRQSGVERWVVLGQVTVPDVISVSQLISLIHSNFALWKPANDRAKDAIELAKKRSSKLYGWIWFGRQNKRLTYAKPTNKVLMATGTTRLRDLITDSGEQLYFQLDVGLLPVELRTAFHMTFLDESREERYQNSKYDMWIPIAPKLSSSLAGLWVPRVEGDALRKWLSIGRLQKEGKRGVTVPKPYHVSKDAAEEFFAMTSTTELEEVIVEEEQLQEEAKKNLNRFFDMQEEEESFSPFFEDEEEDIESTDVFIAPEKEEPPELPVPQEEVEIPTVKQGALDIVLAPYNLHETEPKMSSVRLGNSIAEWEWLEPEQIQMLRKQCLVLVDTNDMKKK